MWTHEPPDGVGWYWFRIVHPAVPESAARPVMMLVWRGADGSRWAEDLINRERYRVHEIEGLWSGPLTPPPRPAVSHACDDSAALRRR